ncbi:MerR family transcriptional regulator [Nocardia alni]|uniref:MerR family transcriptional regulator n=1 Tax=Nocardia alni TaxID=2815723 RepID=UPI001C24C9A9|nr:MerR family transcriptional regulator [Nocardia alni]
MLIGELAERTGTTERQLRYYESAGLLTAYRRANGYRDYDDTAESIVTRIRTLLAAGLSIRLIRQVMPCALSDGSLRPCPGILETLRTQLTRIDQRVTELTQAQEALRRTIAFAEHIEAAAPPITQQSP